MSTEPEQQPATRTRPPRPNARATALSTQLGASALSGSATRAQALVCKNLFGEPSPLLTVGGLELLATLGCGGTGVVYEARDPRRGESVALKMLHQQRASDLYALKREFRSLAALRQPNLVALYELCVAPQQAYFTMELVRGSDLVSYVRAGSRAGARVGDEARLRTALAQLCEAVEALHQAGKLHRDLKPGNVLVSAAGRVVLLDFGLVQDLHERGTCRAGTPTYMAPEQARGAACTASDWYSFGQVLRHALYGPRRAPCAGPLEQDDDARGQPAFDQASGELERLVMRLSSADPEARPTYREIRATLAPGATAAHGERPRELCGGRRFVGRAAELSQLDEVFARSTREPVLLWIRGASGIGKTTLVQHFVETRLAPRGALVLRGRCYERESVPFKALDSIIDALCCVLLALPPAQAFALRPPHAEALVCIFPVLARVHALRGPPDAHAEVHPVELRRRAFAALKSLLASLAARQPLVLCIDDIQWADADSGRLLAALLCADDAVPMLVLGNDRTDPTRTNPTLAEYTRVSALALRPLPSEQLTLRGLPAHEAQQLARALLTDACATACAAREREQLCERVAAESEGNPLLLTELSRWLAGHTEAPLHERAHASLDALFSSRFAALDGPSKRVLTLLAVAGRPLPWSVITHAADCAGPRAHATLSALREARLVHVTPRGAGELLELDHDRVGEALTAGMEPTRRHALHRRLARALEATENAPSETLLDQYLGAQLPREAARHAWRAADNALATLAFLRAAWLYEQALTLGDYADGERARLFGGLARALEHAGKGPEAAAAYQRASALCGEAAEAALLDERAAHHLLLNGDYGLGLALMQRGYQRLGLYWPGTPRRLKLAVLWRLVSSPLRRMGLWPTRVSKELHGVRALFLALAGAGLEGASAWRAVYNTLLCFDAAERSGDEVWRMRTRAARGFLRCASFALGGAARGFREQQRACAWAAAARQQHALADMLGQLALAHGLCGQPRAALEAATRCAGVLDTLPLVPFDRYVIVGVVGSALLELGELREARRRWASYTHEARLHGDLMSSFWIHAHPVHFAILFAAGDRAGARTVLARQRQLCGDHPEYKVLVWAHAMCAAEVELYWGEAGAAARRVASTWSALSGSGYPFMTELARLLSARAALAAAALAPPAAHARLLRRASRAVWAVRVLGGRARAGQRALLHAGLAMLRGALPRARLHLERAIDALDAEESKLVSASARYCLGALLGGAPGRALQEGALACLAAEGVAEPERWVRWSAPGFLAPRRLDHE